MVRVFRPRPPRQYSGRAPRAGSLAAGLLIAAALAGCGDKADPSAGRAAEMEQRAIDETNRELARRNERRQEEAAERRRARTETTSETGGEQAPARPAGLLSAADRASFGRLAESLDGTEAIAVTTLAADPVVTLGDLGGAAAWSTAKAPVAMAAIVAGSASSADLTAAITASDNAAAERLWSGIGSPDAAAAAATEQLRASGDANTTIESRRLRAGYTAFGQTGWALADQARFVAGMACTDAGKQVLELMGNVASGQRWGLGAVGLPAKFKGGWGPGTEPGAAGPWLDRQMGIVEIDGRPIVLAIATSGTNHGAGTTTLTKLAGWAAEHVDAGSAPDSPSCP